MNFIEKRQQLFSTEVIPEWVSECNDSKRVIIFAGRNFISAESFVNFTLDILMPSSN